MRNIVLFDLDGTLTPARKAMVTSTADAICQLTEYADIGIVTGSPIEYIRQQASLLWESLDNPERLKIMPCNGTQLYLWNGLDYEKHESVNMREHLGDDSYRRLIWILLNLQVNMVEGMEIPLSGNFISYRESMLNWCMIGRDATPTERNMFTEVDVKFGIRKKLSEAFIKNLEEFGIKDVDHAIGGNTSIDVYPTGWDKRYALKHVHEYDNVYFVGDKCKPGGNDYALYNELDKGVRFMTSGPAVTEEIISENILPACKAAQLQFE